ncbi:protein-L-isoaspartate(D-aspartate) O-methyltransferase [soil metagenome]
MSRHDGEFSGIGMTSARTRERLMERLRAQGIRNRDVLERIRSVPRHIFVDEALASRAYEDIALPIGHAQTISQPFVVARMTEALIEDGRPHNVLEVGTGCGYQTAVLAPLVGRISSIERIRPLLARARQRMRQLGLNNVHFRYGDGWKGWPSRAPFDGIIVAAAPEDVPQTLLDQLAPGGRLVLPVGPRGRQELVRILRTDDGFEREQLGLVSFVPLVAGTQ